MRSDFLALPYIDEQSVQIGVTREKVWISLVSVLRTDLGHASPALNRLLQLAPGKRSGDWHDTPNVGDTLPGFEVADALVPMRLALRGGHRFSTYALVFELETNGANACTLRAQSWAAFPALAGRAYRALVIGTGGHRLVVRRLLRRAARRA